jgi:tRNA C32,U32 (ribose-2'-O)-methylase TrmJ
MSEHASRHDVQDWSTLTPSQVLALLVYELYTPVSSLSTHLNRITTDDDPLTEEEYEALFEQMQKAVRQLSKTVVNLRRYVQDHNPGTQIER